MTTPPNTADQVRTFAQTLWHPTDLVEVRMFRGEEKKLGWYKASELHSPKVIKEMLVANEQGFNVYVGAHPRKSRGGTAEHVLLARSVFADFDGEVMPTAALAIITAAGLPPPSMMIMSGHGSHPYWLLEEPLTDFAIWTGIQKALISVLHSDEVIHDSPRIMRLPGFINHKQHPRVWATLIESHADRRYRLDQFPPPLLEPDRPAASAPATVTSDWRSKLSKRTLDFIVNGAPEHTRNARLFKAACDVAGQGVSQSEAESLLTAPAQGSGLPDGEIRSTIESAFSKARTPSVPRENVDHGGGGGTLETGAEWGTLGDSGQTPNGKTGPRLSVRNLANVKAEPVIWIWEGRIPAGMLTVIAGDPGGGKSTFTCYVAACVTTGRPWIDDRTGPTRKPGRVLYLTAEDDTTRTLVPRLILAGADMALVDVVEGVILREGKPTDMFSLDRDLDLLRRLVKENNYTLIIIDPITAYLGDKASESHNTSVMRGLLAPIKALCEETGVAVLVVSHLSKQSGNNNATYRVTGSLALPAAARAVYLLAKDPDDEARRLLVIAKMNVGPEPKGVAFRIAGDPPTVQFEDEPVDLTARQLLSRESEKDIPDPAVDEAVAWLQRRLAGGEVAVKVIYADAKTVKIKERALIKASDVLKVIKGPASFGGRWRITSPITSPIAGWSARTSTTSPRSSITSIACGPTPGLAASPT